jgi:hypothetical protein
MSSDSRQRTFAHLYRTPDVCGNTAASAMTATDPPCAAAARLLLKSHRSTSSHCAASMCAAPPPAREVEEAARAPATHELKEQPVTETEGQPSALMAPPL